MPPPFRSALRTELQHRLTPEQLTCLLQGTAGLYQDLRTELKNRFETFEQYALAEILRIPPGLLATPVVADDPNAEVVTEEEEAAVDAELLALQKQIAAGKRRGRDTQAAIAEIDRLVDSLKAKLESLQAVPAVLGSKENLIEDIRAVTSKGVAVEAGCMKLDTLRVCPKGRPSVEAGAGAQEEPLSDDAVEKEILRRQANVRSAPVEDLAAISEAMGLPPPA